MPFAKRLHMRHSVLLVAFLVVAPPYGTAQEKSPQAQISEAVLPAPRGLQDDATVLGYGGSAREGDPLTVLRQGTGSLVCLADDPREEGFHVACYHASLDPFMRLGRRLRAEGRSRSEVMDERHASLEAGTLTMPDLATLYSLTGPEGEYESSEDPGLRRLLVLYVPGATGGQLGLPERPEGEEPWLMLPGTAWAHIMIAR